MRDEEKCWTLAAKYLFPLTRQHLHLARVSTSISMSTRVILPGDSLPASSSAATTSLKLGPGLDSLLTVTGSSPATSVHKGKAREVVANRAGLLGYQEEGEVEKWWVEGQTRRVRFFFSLEASSPQRYLECICNYLSSSAWLQIGGCWQDSSGHAPVADFAHFSIL